MARGKKKQTVVTRAARPRARRWQRAPERTPLRAAAEGKRRGRLDQVWIDWRWWWLRFKVWLLLGKIDKR